MNRIAGALSKVGLGLALALALSACGSAVGDSNGGAADSTIDLAAAPGTGADSGRVTQEQWLSDAAAIVFASHPEMLANLPEVSVIREVLPEEQFDTVVDCVSEAGFPPSERGVSVAWDDLGDQWEAFALARYTCFAQYPPIEDFIQPLTLSQNKFLRQYWIEETIPCLAELGIEIPQPPSEETWLSTIDSPESWHPFLAAGRLGISHGVLDQALQACPDSPPSPELFAQ